VERHGVDDGAVAVEEIGLEVAGWEGKGHRLIVAQGCVFAKGAS
jgi:hypothetical protein